MYVVVFKPTLVYVPQKITISTDTQKINIFANILAKILVTFRRLYETRFTMDFQFYFEILPLEHYIFIV